MKDSTKNWILNIVILSIVALSLGGFIGYMIGSILHLEEQNKVFINDMEIIQSVFDNKISKLETKINNQKILIQQLELKVLDHREELKRAKDYIDNNHKENAKLFDDIFKHLFILEEKYKPKTVINKYYYMPYKKPCNKEKSNASRRCI